MDDDTGDTALPQGEVSYENQLVTWALRYNAYGRLGAAEFEPWGILGVLLKPLTDAFRDDGAIPAWAGVDLLRGWAFLIVRLNRHEDGWLLDEHPEMLAIADAIANHPAAVKSDLPPPRPEGYDPVDILRLRPTR